MMLYQIIMLKHFATKCFCFVMIEYMELTTNGRDYLNQSAVGYMVNTLVGESTQNEIKSLQDTFVSEFQDAVWATPTDALHITLLDWLAPLVDYKDDKDRVFQKINLEYDEVLRSILGTIKPIDVTFNKVAVSSSAIAIIADEKSIQVFNNIRARFLEKVDLLPNTKQPPNIVHSTIVRFVSEISLVKVKKVADTLDFSFVEHVNGFQLVRETTLPMLEYSVIKEYPLYS